MPLPVTMRTAAQIFAQVRMEPSTRATLGFAQLEVLLDIRELLCLLASSSPGGSGEGGAQGVEGARD